jgi:hypothetical protein
MYFLNFRTPIDPFMPVQIKFFGRYKGGSIRDGVLLSIDGDDAVVCTPGWSCDSGAAVAAFDVGFNASATTPRTPLPPGRRRSHP